eukprot:459145_1
MASRHKYQSQIIIVVILLVINLYIKSTQCMQPNIVFFLTDDEDELLLQSTIEANNIMPNRNKIFMQNGIKFTNGFASSPTCCVSRSSILTGKYMHNHHVTNNTQFGNCGNKQFQNEIEPYTYASYLNNNGYNTFHAGKYLNEYGNNGNNIPNGWNYWYSLSGQILYYNYCISNMGIKQCFGNNPNDYISIMIKNKAINFLETIKKNRNNNNENKPFLLVISSIGCHSPFTVEDKYKGIDDGNIAPRTPNWNIIGIENKNNLLKIQTKMNSNIIKQSDEIYSWRLGTLRSIDDTIGEIYNYILNELNEIDNTYFIYLSDHGFHIGQYGMWFGKKLLYETDLRIPLFIHSPNIISDNKKITSKT